MPFPRSDFYFPTKDEVADYLEAYVDKFHLPVRLNTTVDSLIQADGAYLLTASPHRFSATNVIVAAGAYQHPVTPSFSHEIDHGIVHLHSKHGGLSRRPRVFTSSDCTFKQP